MACAFNYLASDASERSRLGMDAAGALKRVRASDDEWEISACDQSNAFTNVLVPAWMWPYSCLSPSARAPSYSMQTPHFSIGMLSETPYGVFPRGTHINDHKLFDHRQGPAFRPNPLQTRSAWLSHAWFSQEWCQHK